MRVIALLLAAAVVVGSPALAMCRPVRIVAKVPADTPAAAEVYVAGSLLAVGGWRADGLRLARQADGSYAADVDLPPGVTLEFKLTRGSWATVERRADGADRDNRTAAITADTARIDATVDRWASGPTTAPASTVVGTLHLHAVDSAALHGARTIRVWLPAAYGTDLAARFGVLYLFDGQNLFDRRTSSFGHEWEVDESLTRLIAAGAVAPLVVVGLDNGPDRLGEYTMDADPTRGGSGGRGAATEAFLLHDVIPFVDRTYRTRSDAAHRLLGGSSLGGLLTLEVGRRHPGAFAGLMVMSPSLWWDRESALAALAADASPLAGSRVWLDVGTAEEAGDEGARDVDRVRRLDAALGRAGVEHRLKVDAGAHHNEQAWSRRFPDAITYLARGK